MELPIKMEKCSPTKSILIPRPSTSEEKDEKVRDWVCLFKITRTRNNITFPEMMVMVETNLVGKWNAKIEKKDEKRKTIFVSFSFLIATRTVQTYLMTEGVGSFLNVEWFSQVPTEENLKKYDAIVKKQKKKEEQSSAISYFKISAVNKEITSLDEMKVALRNTIIQKWYGKMERESEILKQIFVSIPKSITLITVQRYIKKNNLDGFLQIESIDNLTDQKDINLYEVLVTEKLSRKE